jgi:hypothetical protein
MTYSMKSENKLDGASNFRAWKTRIDLILSENKVLDIVKGKIVEPEFEEGKEKEPQNVAIMEKFKDGDINAMSIIVESIKYHLIPYISHLDSSKKMYDALTNIFSIRNIGQVMSLKNELCDMKMNDEDSITSYFVKISQLKDQLQDIEEIILEKELVNIVLNDLPNTRDAFAASQRKGRRNMKHQLSKKRNLQRRLSKMKETSSSEGNNILLISCTYLICIVSLRILYIYLLEDNMFQEELYLWKNNNIRIAIIIQVR